MNSDKHLSFLPMQPLVCFLFLAAIPLLATPASAHKGLLPQPQKITYGKASLPVNGLSLRFATPPNAEDRFAAWQLASSLSAATQIAIPYAEATAPGPVITLKRTGTGPTLPGPNDTTGPDSRESYQLKITSAGVELTAPSSAGLFYGVQTLLQLVEGAGTNSILPEAEIHDWPALPYRGFMMDLSHGPLLRVSEIERQIDTLSRFKANQYYFYSEMSIELQGYEVVNRPNARYTREEVQHLISYARKRHIDIVPCLELYGHMHDLFRVEKFADLGLPRYGDEFDPRNPRTLAVIDDLLDQTAKLFPSPWYHVGFDEPWSLGKIGVTPGTNPFKTFVSILHHVGDRAQKHGKRLMYWADINQGASTLSNHPELLQELPTNAIAVPWVYEDRTNYASNVEPLAQAGAPMVVAPAVWNWNELFPHYYRSFTNINGLTATGKKYGALGVLVTGWTDSAQTIYRMSLPGLALGAAAAWQNQPVDSATFFSNYCSHVYPPTVAAQVAPALEELSTVAQLFEASLGDRTQNAFWKDPLEPARLARIEANKTQLRQCRLLAESAQQRLLRAQRLAPSDPTLPSLLLASRLFDYLGMKSLYAAEWNDYFSNLKANPDPKLVTLFIAIQINAHDHGMLADLLDTVTDLQDDYREAWLAESTSYRLGSAMARWNAEAEHWRATWERSRQIVREHKKDAPFPSIDALRLQK